MELEKYIDEILDYTIITIGGFGEDKQKELEEDENILESYINDWTYSHNDLNDWNLTDKQISEIVTQVIQKYNELD